MPYHLKLISASGDHTSRLWNVTESKLINDREFRGHSRSVKQVTFRKNDCSVFATGGKGCIRSFSLNIYGFYS